jgi:glycosyltransferase involved in cell wall biosynthesis
MSKSKELVLLVPVYNPSQGWELSFMSCYDDFCKSIGHSVPVVLINDGSTTDIQKDVDFLKEKYPDNFNYLSYQPNRGKGGALKYGVVHSKASRYMFTDIDFPYTIESMVRVKNAIDGSSGLVSGYRSQNYYADMSFSRVLLSKMLRKMNKWILGLPVTDTQCGLKAFDASAAEILLTCKTDRFLIDLEFMMALNKKKIKINPVPVELRSDITFSSFNAKILLRELGNFIRILIKYRIF